MDIEAMREEQHLALTQVRLDILGIDVPHGHVGGAKDEDVSPFSRLRDGEHTQTSLLRGAAALARFGERDPYVHSVVTKVQRVGMPLAAVANHRHLLAQ